MKIIFAIFAIALAAGLFTILDQPAPDPSPAPLALSDGTGNLPQAKPQVGQNGPTGESHIAAPLDATAKLLPFAQERLENVGSISALVRYRARLFESDLIGSGLYQQAGQGAERRLRLELKTQLGDKTAVELQVCDGEALWTYREGINESRLERLDLRRVRMAQQQAAQATSLTPISELATGGLPKLLSGLQTSFRPLSAEEGYLGDVAVWAIELEWMPSVLAALVPEQQAQINAGKPCDFSQLPQMPERVVVFLGHDDLFPRRIEFRRRTDESSGSGSAGQGSASPAAEGQGGVFAAAVTLEFTDVRLNQLIDPRQFVYAPGQLGPNDVTDAYLRNRGLPIVR
jgi:hypothetical protein